MKTLRCQMNSRLWWTVAMCVLMGAFFLIVPFLGAEDDPKTSLRLFLVICVPPVAVIAYAAFLQARCLLREEIVADETGLRWRGAFGPWKSAKWDEISDFYLLGKATKSKTAPVQTETARAIPIVETPHGALKISRTFTHLDELLPLIAARAQNAPGREWEICEFRSAQNFSRRFTYWTKGRRWEAIWLSANVGFLWIAALWMMIFSPKTSHSAEDWKWLWLPALLMIVLFGGLGIGALFGVGSLWRDRNFCLKHRAESVELSLEEIIWSDEKTEIRADWSQVRAVKWVAERGPRGHYRVETEAGNFSVWVVLEQINVWVSLVRHFAPHLRFQTPYEAQRARTGTRWNGPGEGEGAQIFGFRGSELRTFPLLPLVISWVPLLVRQIGAPDDKPPLPLPVALVLALMGSVAAFYGFWFFRSAAIWADGRGLEIHIPLRRASRIAWQEIEALGRDERGAFVRAGGRKTHLFSGLELAGRNELLQLIAQLATNATGRFD